MGGRVKTLSVDIPDDDYARYEELAARDHRPLQDYMALVLQVDLHGVTSLWTPAQRAGLDDATRHSRDPVSPTQRAAIYKRDGGVCSYCRKTLEPFGEWHIDHVIPVRKGGSSEPGNLALSCKPCNRKKHTRDANEFRTLLESVPQNARG